MRAELAAIEDAGDRVRFARSASAAAFGRGCGVSLAAAAGAGVVVAGAALVASRVQLHTGGPGVLPATVVVPAVALLVVAFLSARTARSFRFGVMTGFLALAATFLAVFGVLAVEGQVWMERRGIFMLDGDPPRQAVGSVDVALDLFSTGMWIGHLVFWLPWPVIGAALGTRLKSRRALP